MTGAIIIITVCYYLLSIGISMGLSATHIHLPWVGLFLPPLIAGYLGALQFIRTEVKLMGVGDRLICAAKSCLAIILTPIAFSLIVLAARSLSIGLAGLGALPGIAAILTLNGLLETLIFMIYGLPLIFIGLTAGQWIKSQRFE